MIGRRLAHYEITGLLGKGGMGEVYRARDTRLGREVALKVLPDAVASSPDRLARLEREARTVAALNHPNIVTLFSVEDQDGTRFLTMELVDGRSLADVVEPGGLPLARVLAIAVPLADALVAAHERGVVHRDLKPGNVMLTDQGRVKVLDFGLAKLAAAATMTDATEAATMQTPLSSTGTIVGTVPYMAPEQLRGGAVDARTDLFALGIILYELAAGRRPFAGGNFVEMSSSILRDAPEPLTSLRADLPPEIDRIVARCLEKDPRDRVQTALDVRNDLRRLQREPDSGHAAPTAESTAVASIAVLPFANLSRDEENEYFSDGLADELLGVLAKLRGLRVVARTSSFVFRGKDATIAHIGRALNVATVLEGSVRKAGNRVRISVQLVRVSDSSHLWSGTYDRTLEDIFAVQDDIAHSVVKELRTTLAGERVTSSAADKVEAEVADAARGRSSSPEAHRLYLLALHLQARGTKEDSDKAMAYLTQALDLDPEFALAWAALGQFRSNAVGRNWLPIAEGFKGAREAIDRALELEPDLPEGLARRAWLQMYRDHDWKGARASYERALQLAPGSATVLNGLGVLAYDLDDLEEAIDLLRRVVERNPLATSSIYVLGMALHRAGRLVEAEEAFRRSLELAPRRSLAHGALSQVLLAQGRGQEALAEAAAEPAEWRRLMSFAITHHVLGNRAESDAALEELIATLGDHAAYQIAEVHGARGEVTAAFEWLELALQQEDPGVAEAKGSPDLRSLHGDPRWTAFLRRMGFES